MADVSYNATNSYDGDGLTDTFPITFTDGYMDESHVLAYIEDPETYVRRQVGLTFVGEFTVKVDQIPQVGEILTIYRQTPAPQMVDFEQHNKVTAKSLNTQAEQSLKVAVEARDLAGNTQGFALDAQNAARDALLASEQAEKAVADAKDQIEEFVDDAEERIGGVVEAFEEDTGELADEIIGYRDQAFGYMEAAESAMEAVQNVEANQAAAVMDIVNSNRPLSDAIDSDSSTTSASSKAVKDVKDSLGSAAGADKSDSVTSDSSNTVATSKAVKQAYDRKDFDEALHVEASTDRKFSFLATDDGHLSGVNSSAAGNIGFFDYDAGSWLFRYRKTDGAFFAGSDILAKASDLKAGASWQNIGDIPHFTGAAGNGYARMHNHVTDSDVDGSVRLYTSGTFAYCFDGVEKFSIKSDGNINSDAGDITLRHGSTVTNTSASIGFKSTKGWAVRYDTGNGNLYKYNDSGGGSTRVALSGDSVVWNGGEYSMNMPSAGDPSDMKLPSGYVMTGLRGRVERRDNTQTLDWIYTIYARKLKVS